MSVVVTVAKMQLRETKFCMELKNSSRLNQSLLGTSPGVSMKEGYVVYFTLGLAVLCLSYLFVYIREKCFRDTVS